MEDQHQGQASRCRHCYAKRMTGVNGQTSQQMHLSEYPTTLGHHWYEWVSMRRHLVHSEVSKQLSSLHFNEHKRHISSPRQSANFGQRSSSAAVRIIGSPFSLWPQCILDTSHFNWLRHFTWLYQFVENQSVVCSLCRIVTRMISPFCAVLLSEVI